MEEIVDSFWKPPLAPPNQTSLHPPLYTLLPPHRFPLPISSEAIMDVVCHVSLSAD